MTYNALVNALGRVCQCVEADIRVWDLPLIFHIPPDLVVTP